MRHRRETNGPLARRAWIIPAVAVALVAVVFGLSGCSGRSVGSTATAPDPAIKSRPLPAFDGAVPQQLETAVFGLG